MRSSVSASSSSTGATAVRSPPPCWRAAGAGAAQVVVDLLAHHLGLAAHHLGQRPGLRLRLGVSITDSGVFSAWARLPTWVRWRSTTSWLWATRALSSRASGSSSAG